MYARDPFNRNKSPSAFSLLQNAATRTVEQSTQVFESTKQQAVEATKHAVEATKQAIQDSDMSFAVPRNVPQFESAQRRFEENVWSKVTGNEKGLPMYKDKPTSYGGARGRRGFLKSKRGLAVIALVVFGFFYWIGWSGSSQTDSGDKKKENGKGWMSGSSGGKKGKVDWNKRREDVKDAFLLSWNAYEQNGWGEDYSLYVAETKADCDRLRRIPPGVP
jgi:hypothetical protein